MTQVAVFGAGSWGTAYSAVLADAGATVRIHARRPEIADSINTRHHNPDYLPELRLPTAVQATADPEHAVQDADMVVLAVPSQSLRENLQTWGPLLPRSSARRALAR